MDFFSQTYAALRGPTGQPQTAEDTLGKLADRLSPAVLPSDRRSAVFALKGLARDHRRQVGEVALPGLLDVLQNDSEADAESAKAVLETLIILCEVDQENEHRVGLQHQDVVTANAKPTHKLLDLLSNSDVYTRLPTLQLLEILLLHRRQPVQGWFLSAQNGPGVIVGLLEDKREMIRTQALLVIQLLTSQNADIQKILAFEGAFEKLLGIATTENGIEGGAVVRDALACLDGLLRSNVSNQSYFRELGLWPTLVSLLLYPPHLSLQEPAPQEFALQFWDSTKMVNAAYVIGILSFLAGNKGTNATPEHQATYRLFVETALAANAPTTLKLQALRCLPRTANPGFSLPGLTLTPYIPVPDTNGEEWDRLDQTSALDALVTAVLRGEYGLGGGLEFRRGALSVFSTWTQPEEIRHAVLNGMHPQPGADPTPLLQLLAQPPSSSSDSTSILFACLLFSSLIRGAHGEASQLARTIQITAIPAVSADTGEFFVPADGPPANPPVDREPSPGDEADGPQTLLATLSEHLSLALLIFSRSEGQEQREALRTIVGYLVLLSQWLWEDAQAARDFLDGGGMGILVEPINEPMENADPLVQGLCAFLLGICYERSRSPGEISRQTIHAIINRLSTDAIAERISRVREDERFRSVVPESASISSSNEDVWFDWPFVDFFKSTYYTIQNAVTTEPDSLPATGQDPDTQRLIAELRDEIRKQVQEIDELRANATSIAAQAAPPPATASTQLPVTDDAPLKAQVAELEAELAAANEKRNEVEKEQEDLLVLLDELSTKRKADKERLRTAGMDVSEDEDEEAD